VPIPSVYKSSHHADDQDELLTELLDVLEALDIELCELEGLLDDSDELDVLEALEGLLELDVTEELLELDVTEELLELDVTEELLELDVTEELLLELDEDEWLDHEELLSLDTLEELLELDSSSIQRIRNRPVSLSAGPGKKFVPVWKFKTLSGEFTVPSVSVSRSRACHIVFSGSPVTTAVVAAAPTLALY